MKTGWNWWALSFGVVVVVAARPYAQAASPTPGVAASPLAVGGTRGASDEVPKAGGTEEKPPATGAEQTKPGESGPASERSPAPIPGTQASSSSDNGAPDEEIWVKGRTRKGATRVEVSLGDYVILKLNASLQTYLQEEKVGHKIGIYINGLFFKDLPPMAVPGRQSAVMFHLVRTDDNRESWGVLFARKGFGNTSADLTCDRDPKDGITVTVGYEDGSQVGPTAAACLEYFPDRGAAVFLIAGASLILVLTLALAVTTPLLRDVGIPPPGRQPTWSLARFQMALWFVTILCGVLFAYAVTGDISPIPPGALILMGIGAGTAVSAFAIDATTNMPGTKADYRALRNARVQLDARAKAIQAQIEDKKGNAAGPELPALQTRLDDLKKEMEPINRKLAPYEVPGSRSFLRDILSDGNGIAFHRLQVFAWTMTYWSIFVTSLLHKITLIDFPVSQLTLMGISGATYLGFKLQEPPKEAGPAQTSGAGSAGTTERW